MLLRGNFTNISFEMNLQSRYLPDILSQLQTNLILCKSNAIDSYDKTELLITSGCDLVEIQPYNSDERNITDVT